MKFTSQFIRTQHQVTQVVKHFNNDQKPSKKKKKTVNVIAVPSTVYQINNFNVTMCENVKELLLKWPQKIVKCAYTILVANKLVAVLIYNCELKLNMCGHLFNNNYRFPNVTVWILWGGINKVILVTTGQLGHSVSTQPEVFDFDFCFILLK